MEHRPHADPVPSSCSRPRMFGGELEPVRLPWSWALELLEAAGQYWIATTRPDGRPHSRPVWGVVVDGRVHFSTGSLAATNLAHRPEITVHAERGTEVVIIEGTARLLEDRATLERVCARYDAKYCEHLDPDGLPGPFRVVEPHVAFGWLASPTFLDGGAVFHGTATRWTFP